MRNQSLLVFCLATLLSLFSCQKEVSIDTLDGSGNPANRNGNLKAKINGSQWTADKGAAASRVQGFITISGISVDRKTLAIQLVDSGVHKYVLSDETVNTAALVDSTDNTLFAYTTNQGDFPTESGGEVTITSINTAKKTISGTFSFRLFREVDGGKKTITEGSFTDLSYEITLPPTAVADTFRVKIDGTSWTPASVKGISANGQLAITANNSDASKTVALIFPANIQPGNYTLEFLGGTHIGMYNPDQDPSHAKASVSGTLTILEHNTSTKRIRGNFAFRGEELLNPANAAQISEGYFSVKY